MNRLQVSVLDHLVEAQDGRMLRRVNRRVSGADAECIRDAATAVRVALRTDGRVEVLTQERCEVPTRRGGGLEAMLMQLVFRWTTSRAHATLVHTPTRTARRA